MSDVTRILSQIQTGNPSAADKLLTLLYGELRNLAAAKLAQENPGHTLQASALVHEAYLRLVGNSVTELPLSTEWDHRGHFFGAAAEAMRRILVENARRKASLKRGGVWERKILENLTQHACYDAEQILDIDEALQKLAEAEPQAAELVKLRIFAGLTIEEAASCLGMSSPSADTTWSFAKSWLQSRDRGRTVPSQPVVKWFVRISCVSGVHHGNEQFAG